MLMKLNRYGIQIKQWLKNEYPIRYQELILDGTLMDKIYERQKHVGQDSPRSDNHFNSYRDHLRGDIAHGAVTQ